MQQQENNNLFDLQIDQSSINYLNEAARWSRFLSIIGFIYCGLMVLMGIFFGTFMARMMPLMGADSPLPAVGSGAIGFVIILLALLLFFPAYYLYNFSSKMRRALRSNDQIVLTESLKNLKSFFKFYGILVIIVVSFYILIFFAALIGVMVGSRH